MNTKLNQIGNYPAAHSSMGADSSMGAQSPLDFSVSAKPVVKVKHEVLCIRWAHISGCGPG